MPCTPLGQRVNDSGAPLGITEEEDSVCVDGMYGVDGLTTYPDQEEFITGTLSVPVFDV